MCLLLWDVPSLKLQRNESHVLKPMGGVRARPLFSAEATDKPMRSNAKVIRDLLHRWFKYEAVTSTGARHLRQRPSTDFRKNSGSQFEGQMRRVGRRGIFSRSERSLKRATLPGEFELELGGSLRDVELVWEEWGPSKAQKVVLLFPSFSVSSHAKSTVEDATAGWYEHFIGPRKAIDTDEYRIICPSNLGSPFGSTSPKSVNRETGKAWGKHFLQITPFDMARAARLLLEKLEVGELHSVMGGSLGGNLTLQVRRKKEEKSQNSDQFVPLTTFVFSLCPCFQTIPNRQSPCHAQDAPRPSQWACATFSELRFSLILLFTAAITPNTERFLTADFRLRDNWPCWCTRAGTRLTLDFRGMQSRRLTPRTTRLKSRAI